MTLVFPLNVLAVRFGPLTVCVEFCAYNSSIHSYHDGHLLFHWFIKQLYCLIFHLLFDALINSSCATCLGPVLSQGKIVRTLSLSRKDWFFQLYICVLIDTFYPTNRVQDWHLVCFPYMGALLWLVFLFTMYSAVWLPSRFFLYIPTPQVFTRILWRPFSLSLWERSIFLRTLTGFTRLFQRHGFSLV